jgi:hypothetical protein
VRSARPGEGGPVVVGHAAARIDAVKVLRCGAATPISVCEHPDRGQLRGRLHDPRKHQRPERLVGDGIESQPPVRVEQDLLNE